MEKDYYREFIERKGIDIKTIEESIVEKGGYTCLYGNENSVELLYKYFKNHSQLYVGFHRVNSDGKFEGERTHVELQIYFK